MAQNALTSPFANQPSSLPSPTPNSDLEKQFQQFVGNAPTPEVNAPQADGMEQAPVPAPAQTPSTDLEAQFSQFLGPAEGEAPTMTEEQTPGFVETNVQGLRQQANEAFTRLRNSFAVTNKNSEQVLKESGLFQDIRLNNQDEWEVIRKGKRSWEKLDSDQLELIGDAMDLGRDAMESVIENVGRIGGFFGGAAEAAPAGAVSGAPAGPVGSAVGAASTGLLGGVAGAALGGATGAVAAKNAGDYVAERFFKIEHDPSRNMTTENATAAAFGAGFNLLSSGIARRQAKKAAERLEAKKTLQYAKGKIDAAIDEVNNVANSGIKLDAPGGKFRLDPQQIVGAGNIPELDVAAKELSTMESFRNFRREQGKVLGDAFDSVANSLGSVANGTEVGKDFVLKTSDIRKVEGKLIDSYRKLAKKELVGVPQPAQRAVEETKNMLQGFGGSLQATDKGLKLVAPSADQILNVNPALTKTQAGALSNEIKDIGERLLKANGNLTVDESKLLYDRLTTKINKTINTQAGRPFALELVKLKNAVRDDWTDAMGKVLPENMLEEYGKSKARYSEIMGGISELKNVLKTEDLSRNSLIDTLFAGKQSLKNARAAKAIIQESDPEFWGQLTSEYFKKLKLDNLDAKGNLNWNSMFKQWGKLGSEMQEEILQGSDISREAVGNLINLGTKVQNSSFPFKPKQQDIGLMKKLFLLTSNVFVTTKADIAQDLLSGMGKDKAVALWLQDGGLEQILNEMPGLAAQKKNAWRNIVNAIDTSKTKKAVTPLIKTRTRREFEEE